MKANILLVDDDEDMLLLFQRILQGNGYSVEAATTGRRALELCESSGFQLAIVDIKLPDIPGNELVRRLRENDDEMAFILITGYPSLQACIDSLDLGIHEILLKPIEVDELLSVTDAAISPEISV
ncbi:response regulator [Candidatus Bathyarchaeota archaeon]|nr:response regulator [Candidatus Bathyarchaeota archaeon]MBL7168996.1 response regulator [Candidatus Bathyarchaeota archaeon]